MRAVLFLVLIVTWPPGAFAAERPACNSALLTSNESDGNTGEQQRSVQMPFPDLAGALSKSLGISRPPPPLLDPLPSHPDPELLPKMVLLQILEKMAAYSNWATVAYGSSSGTTEGRIYAEWNKRDAREAVYIYLNHLSVTQRKIAIASFKGGMAEVPADRFPDVIGLEWVQKNFPERPQSGHPILLF